MLLCMVFVETYICFSRFSLVAYISVPSILLIDINIRLLPFCFLLLFCLAHLEYFIMVLLSIIAAILLRFNGICGTSER